MDKELGKMDFGNLSNWIMLIILAIAIGVMVAVMYYGSHHDAHTEIRSAESSRAVQKLQAQEQAAERKFGKASAPEQQDKAE